MSFPTPHSAPAIPDYLQRRYWWAYVHPRAVRFFERNWLVNLILWGHYRRLSTAALDALAGPTAALSQARIPGRVLQIACVYGPLSAQLWQRLAPGARLDVLDVLPVQLANLAAKLPQPLPPTLRLIPGDARALPAPDGHYDQVLLFFLLHEMPEPVRRATLAEALRVLRPGGRLVIVDYHRPHRWHPLRPVMAAIFRWLEPYAAALWEPQALLSRLPEHHGTRVEQHRTWFGGLYQMLVLRG